MGEVIRRRPSPALAVSILALVVAVGGTAVAGPGKLNKKEKKQTRNIAKKQVNKLAPGLSVASAARAGSATSATNATNAANATNAVNATNAANADTVDGADVIPISASLDVDDPHVIIDLAGQAEIEFDCDGGIIDVQLVATGVTPGIGGLETVASAQWTDTGVTVNRNEDLDFTSATNDTVDMNGGDGIGSGTFAVDRAGAEIAGNYQFADTNTGGFTCYLNGFAVSH